MATWRYFPILMLISGFVCLSGCKSNVDDACQNISNICYDGQRQVTCLVMDIFDQARCEDELREEASGGDVDCLASTASCADAINCYEPYRFTIQQGCN